MKHGHLHSEISRNGILQVDFAVTNSTGLSDLLSARGLAHSHRITDLFFVSSSAQGLAHCQCQLPQAVPHLACCCFLSVGIHTFSPPQYSI